MIKLIRPLVTLAILLSASIASATTYYVRTDGNNGNAGTANTSGGAWLTIAKGCSTAAAGDTVRVQAGTYAETASGCTSGTSGAGNTVTLVADGTVTTCGMSFTGKSYIRIIGFTMNPNASSCGGSPSPIVVIAGTNTGLEFWNNDVGNLAGHGIITPTPASDRCNKCIVFGGAVHDISNGNNGVTLLGDDNYVGYVNFTAICYIGVNPSGSRGRFINLNFSGFSQCNATHPDFFYINVSTPGFSNNLVEAMYGVGTISSTDNKSFHAQNDSAAAWTDDVWRLNTIYNMGSGFFSMYDTTNALTRWRFYNSTIVNCERANNSSQYDSCGTLSAQAAHGLSASIVNMLFYQAWADVVTSNVGVWSENLGSPVVTKNYNLAYSPLGSDTFQSQWTGQANPQTNVNPSFVNVGSDFTLQSGSGARGAGGKLTTAASCSGTTLNLASGTGSFFIGDNSANLAAYSGGFVPGDFLTINATTYQVVSRSTDALTLNTSLTCSNGDAVYFGKSATIDIGAYPYKAGGYTLTATYTSSGGTVTITPNDASLVRFAVCYSDGVPYAVANASPYTCTAAAGAQIVKVYPAYAGSTQSVDATTTSSSGGAPLRRIIRRAVNDKENR